MGGKHSAAVSGRQAVEVVLIALGANLRGPDGASPLATCRRAAAALDHLVPGLRLASVSRWYRTPAHPPGRGFPDFVNGVARLEGRVEHLDPAVLLAALHRVEASAGRVRGARDAPRTLDLDLIALGAMVRAAPDPVLPHPRAHLRPFVLRPLADVAPGWRHPGLGRSVEALLAGLPGVETVVPLTG